jgi:dephospho-CoA kinase
MAFRYAIALTGGIATGKSSVSKLFAQDGFDIIDADKVAHMMLDRYASVIASKFGSHIVSGGEVNRKALGELVFSDEEKREELEELLHPAIYEEIATISESFDTEFRPYIIDIPLFFEGGSYDIDDIVVVYAPAQLQLQRLMQRDGISKEDALLRINSQLPIDHKKSLATHLIDNSSTVDNLINEYKKVRDDIIGGF